MNELWKVGARLRYVLNHATTQPAASLESLSGIIRELDPIGSARPSSYPFLAVARHIGADYGDVLWFVDYLTTYSPTPRDDPRFSGAIERLSHEQRSHIASQVSAVRRRQEEAR